MLPALVSLVAAATVFQPVPSRTLTSPDGQRRLELGVLSAPLKGELSTAVEAWALSQRERYGLPAYATLVRGESFGTRFGASFHLHEQVGGIEVYGAQLVVTLDQKARVVQVASSLARAPLLRDDWRVSREEALARAARAVPLPLLKDDGRSAGAVERQLFAVGDELHAGYLAAVPSVDLSKNWYVALDATTGEVLFAQNRVLHDALTADVYPVSPGGLDAGVGATPTVPAELAHSDGGSMLGSECEQSLPDGGVATWANDGGELCGDQLTAFNCCPTEGCAPDAGVKRVTGRTLVPVFGYNLDVAFDVGVCDRLRRASNVTNPTGDFRYQPADPPVNTSVVDPADPANSDAFAEVHAFYHVNRVYDWVRGLSAAAAPLFPGNQPAIVPFTMRDERRTPARKPAVWANVMFPNFNELQQNITGLPGCLTNPPCHTSSSTLLRIDNAAFFPKENFADLPVPGFDTGVDTLMIFQGNAADAAYDATVLQHEFGHGVVYSTAALTFDDLAIDSYSANNEGGALHEGFADYIAAAFNNLAEVGPYFGPRALGGASQSGVAQETFLRTMNNTFTCPTVLWGEVHQDSQHVAGALWDGRKGPFAGSDQGATFDAAFYAMLVSLAPNADFASMAAAMSDKVGRAFPTIADAAAQMDAIFAARGVTGCDKVIDLTSGPMTRPYYGISAAPQTLSSSLIPGPTQFKLHLPAGPAARVSLTGTASSGGLLPGSAPQVTVLEKLGTAILFTRSGSLLRNDADRTQAATVSASSGSLTAQLDFCGNGDQDVYVTLGATGGGATLQNLAFTVTALPSCGGADAGVDAGVDGGSDADAGVDAGVDGGTDTTTTPSVGPDGSLSGPPATGCGCSTPVDAAPLLSFALLALLRRRRR